MKACVYAKVCAIAITHNVIPTCLHSIPSVKCSITAVYVFHSVVQSAATGGE